MRAWTTARVANVSLQADRYQTGVWGSGGSPSLRFPLGFGFRVFWRRAAVARCRRGAEQRTSGMPPVRSRPASDVMNLMVYCRMSVRTYVEPAFFCNILCFG